jgi:hypothetical protein
MDLFVVQCHLDTVYLSLNQLSVPNLQFGAGFTRTIKGATLAVTVYCIIGAPPREFNAGRESYLKESALHLVLRSNLLGNVSASLAPLLVHFISIAVENMDILAEVNTCGTAISGIVLGRIQNTKEEGKLRRKRFALQN